MAGSFYSKGYYARYDFSDSMRKYFGVRSIEIRVSHEARETAEVDITVDEIKNISAEQRKRIKEKIPEKLIVERKTGNVISNHETMIPLIFFYDIPTLPGEQSATFGEKLVPYFSTELTNFTRKVHARVSSRNSDNVVVWYHESNVKSYGPQYSWELGLYDDDGNRVGTIVNDFTSGLLLNAIIFEGGLGSINLSDTNFPTGLNRWVIFYGLNSILLLWGIFHILRARKHLDEWNAHWSAFALDWKGISKFFIRLMAFTIFDFAGIGILTGNLKILLVSDLIGFALMIYATGFFAFPIIFKFVPWIAGFAVGAQGRTLDYVQYPFGVPLYLTAVLMFLLHRYLAYRYEEKKGFERFLSQLPEVTREAVLKELESDVESDEN
ncbi:MAG: hypothetical protein PHP64_03815 [Actinomycetota bacterium]|nr:hypothetical protein [Actinomycetota bacterium]